MTNGCHPGNAADLGTGSAEKAMDRPSSPMGEVRVRFRSDALHRNTRSASAADAKTFGSRGCAATACRSARCPCTCTVVVGGSSGPFLNSTSQISHRFVPNTNSRGTFPRSLLGTFFFPGGGMPIGRQSSDRSASGPSRGYGDANRKLCGPSVSSADAANFRSNTARLFSSGARPGPSVLGRPTTTTSPSATSHVCTHPSAPPLSIVSPSGRGSRQRTPEYVVVPSLR